MDAVVLDLMLPEMSGTEVCKQLRREGNDVPILMLTARGAVPNVSPASKRAPMTTSSSRSRSRSSTPASAPSSVAGNLTRTNASSWAT